MLLDLSNPMHPDNLMELSSPIAKDLYVRGTLQVSDKRSVAIVGTRRPTVYGIETARRITEAAVSSGYTVVSGLARGIDTEAHRTALRSGGRTIAVLGNGIERIYPEENHWLADEISQNGAVISEFDPGVPPRKQNFPIRNRTVVQLSESVVVIEAPEKSGSLITAGIALSLGKKVYVVPGRIGDDSCLGNLELLKTMRDNPNLQLITSFDEPFLSGGCIDYEKGVDLDLNGEERKVYDILNHNREGLIFDQIVVKSGFGAEELPSVLLNLVLRDVVEEKPGKIFKLL